MNTNVNVRNKTKLVEKIREHAYKMPYTSAAY